MTWLEVISQKDLWALLRGLHGSEGMVVEGTIFNRLAETAWERFSEEGGEWRRARIANGGEVVDICERARSVYDSAHQCARILCALPRETHLATGGGLDTNERDIYRQCKCGAREALYSHFSKPVTKLLSIGRPNWTLHRSAESPVPAYEVCPRAKCADDPEHALLGFEFDRARCICRWAFRRSDAPNEDLPAPKLMDAY